MILILHTLQETLGMMQDVLLLSPRAIPAAQQRVLTAISSLQSEN